MIYTNKMQIFYTKIRFATKICKVLFISHGRARIDTDMRNISVDQCNQWELMSHGRAQIDTDTRNIYSPTRYAQEIIVRPKGDKKSKLSQLKRRYGNNNSNNINPTTCCAQNNTLRAQGEKFR